MVKLLGRPLSHAVDRGAGHTTTVDHTTYHATPTEPLSISGSFASSLFPPPPSDSLPIPQLRPATTSSSFLWLPATPAMSRLQAIAA